MNEQQFKTAIIDSKLFKQKPIFAQKTCLKHRVTEMYVYYEQAKRYGVEYLKQNPNILSSEVGIIEAIINK